MTEEERILSQAVDQTLAHEKMRVDLLRAMNAVLNLSQDIEDIIVDRDLLDSVKLISIQDKTHAIQRVASTILPG